MSSVEYNKKNNMQLKLYLLNETAVNFYSFQINILLWHSDRNTKLDVEFWSNMIFHLGNDNLQHTYLFQ